MEESQDPWKGQRTSCSITIYAGNECSIFDAFTVTKVPQPKGSFFSTFGLSSSSRVSPLQTNGQRFTAVIEGLPETIKNGTLIIRMPQNKKEVTVNDYEIYVPDTMSKIAEIFQGKQVEITDLSMIADGDGKRRPKPPMIGTLEHKNGDIIELRDQTGVSTYAELPRSFSVKVSETSVFDVIHPYVISTLKAPTRFLESSNSLLMVMNYGASGIYYQIGHTFTLANNSTMEIITTANITNDTSARFVGALISMVENVNTRPLTGEAFEQSRYNAVQQQQQFQPSAPPSAVPMYAAKMAVRSYSKSVTGGGVGDLSSGGGDEDSSSSPELSDASSSTDDKQEQKTTSIPEPILLEPRTTKTMVVAQIPNVACQLQYIYNPQFEPNAVGMSLFWENNSRNNPLLGKELPHGLATVYKEQISSSGSVSQTKLGTTYISSEHSKPYIRMNLGVANMIKPKFTSLTPRAFTDRGQKEAPFTIEFANKMAEDVTVLVRFRFERANWKVLSETIKFARWGPENQGEPAANAVGKAEVKIPRGSRLKVAFTAVYDIE